MHRPRIIAALSLLLGACGGGGGGGPSGPDDFLPCNASKPCPSGQFCYNGLCALGCNSNGDCARDQYCDTSGDRLCHNKSVSTCPDTPCASGQVCVKGLCSTPPPDTMCTPRFDQNDGCESNAICLPEDQDKARCYTFPYCPENGQCPTGTSGAVCNDGYLPGKARICLTSACASEKNCPAAWRCVKFNANDVLGSCSNGGRYSPCNTSADCSQGLTCQSPAPGFPTYCDMVTLKGPGQPCQVTAECQEGLGCRPPAQGFPSQCTPPGQRGDYCRTSDDCVGGLTCESPAPGVPGSCG